MKKETLVVNSDSEESTVSPKQSPKRQWIPSASWVTFIRRLIRKVSFKERLILLAGLTLPAVNRITNIGSFGVAVKAINMATQEDLTPEKVYMIAGVVVGVFVLAGLIRSAAGKIELAIDGIALKMVRGIVADQLVALQKAPEDVRQKQLEVFVKGERQFVKNASGLLTDLIKFVSLILVVVLLMALISWLAPLVAGVLIAGLVVILFMMRIRIHGPIRSDKAAGKRAKEELARLREDIATGSSGDDELIGKYLKNDADQLDVKKEKTKQKRKSGITIVSGVSAALAMATALFVAARGDFADIDHSLLIVMILALRLASGQGRTAMDKWSVLLGERESLGQLRRMVEAGRERVVPLMEEAIGVADRGGDDEEDS